MYRFKRYLLYIFASTIILTHAHYSEKELAALIESERRALDAQERLLQQSPDNKNMKRSIEQTIVAIKSRITQLKNQMKRSTS